MNPENSIEIKQKKYRFFLYYFVAILLIGIIFAGLFSGDGDSVKGILALKKQDEQKAIARADSLLHSYLKNLQILDEEGIHLFTDSVYTTGGTSLQEKIDRLDTRTGEVEGKIAKAIGNLSLAAKSFTTEANRNSAANLINAYEVACKNHQTLKDIRSVLILSMNNSENSAQLFARLQTEMQRKNKRIEMLEAEIADYTRERNFRAAILSSSINSSDNLLKQEQSKTAYLSKINEALKQDNDRLLLEIGKYRQNEKTAATEK
jgi:hypothetical protein